jgi:hypothetical protein
MKSRALTLSETWRKYQESRQKREAADLSYFTRIFTECLLAVDFAAAATQSACPPDCNCRLNQEFAAALLE